MIRYSYYTLKFLFTATFLKVKGVNSGKKPMFMKGIPIIKAYGKINIGAGFRISCSQFKTELFSAKGATLNIGNNVFINRGVSIAASESIDIGDNCLIADMVSIQDSNWHEITEAEGTRRGCIRIGNNVWIGRNVMILPGVTIGDHAVIAAGSIISTDIPAKSMAYQERLLKLKTLNCADNYKRK